MQVKSCLGEKNANRHFFNKFNELIVKQSVHIRKRASRSGPYDVFATHVHNVRLHNPARISE